MRVTVEFEITEEHVSLVDPDGTVSPIFPTHYMTEDSDIDPTDEAAMSHRLRDSIYTLMEDGEPK